MATAIIQDLTELRQRLAPHLAKARKAIVFGSVARGEADEWSDLDLVIVADTPRPFFERYRDFAGIYDVWPRLDLLVYTPEEFERMRAEGRPFIEQVLAEGIVVHEAEADLAFAELGVREGYPAQACFMCQQAGEKALTSLRYLAGERLVIGHSMVELLGTLLPRHGELADLQEAARRLDQYYVPTRYPNGLPGGVPAEVFSRAQATEAVALARQIVERSAALIGG